MFLATRPLPAGRPAFLVAETFWGCVIRPTEGPPLALQVAQGAVLGFGAATTGLALALGFFPSEGAGGLPVIRGGLSVLLGLVALLLLWYATRGAVVEVHVDVARGELREVVRHRAGRPTVLARHRLGPGAAVLTQGGGAPGAVATLALRPVGNGPSVWLARGPEAELASLRQRLEQELMLGSRAEGGGGRAAA